MRTDARPAFRPQVVELVAWDVPTWFAVVAPTTPSGEVGVTDATHTGQLTFAPSAAPVAGQVTVSAPISGAAIAVSLAGSIGVNLAGQTTKYTFGPDTVGTSAADQKPFLAVVIGTTVSFSFEDMAGQPGCDYDYNDRTWGGVTVADIMGVVFADSYTLTGVGGSAAVDLKVTQADTPDAPYVWLYELTNNTTWGHGYDVYDVTNSTEQFRIFPSGAVAPYSK